MSITKQWIIASMQSYPKTADDLTDVICIVDWRRSATTIVDEKEYYTDVYGALSVPAPDPADFVPYDQVTYDMVCGWLDAGLPVAEIDVNLDVALEQLINPSVVTLPLPFVNP